MSANNGSPVYAVRVSKEARRQLDAELTRLYDASGEAAAVWRDGIEEAIASLATLPERCPAPTRTNHRRFASIQIRHGAQAPLTDWPTTPDDE